MPDRTNDKIEAIYELREAADAKARADVEREAGDTPHSRDVLLDASLELEDKTQDAINLVLEDSTPLPDDVRSRIGATHDNVVDVDFRPQSERSRG